MIIRLDDDVCYSDLEALPAGRVFHLDADTAEMLFHGSGKADFLFEGWHKKGADGVIVGPFETEEEAEAG